ncbi:ATP-binding protein [Paenibacillus sp. SYP-B4298]|uniref:ATP-binding protein n=1 Tax=Paenibacillus sp. SYP-B4298 TaxID=2996034 RepID=UPI0022DE280A|nr:ATP-binding protein [Paenibacillus sp. SYP-B4298]
MKSKLLLWLGIPLFIVLQVWCSFLTFYFPYHGIYLELTPQQQWIVKELPPEGAGFRLGIQVGDIVQQVDGRPPDESPFVTKWQAVEQAHTLVIMRDGAEQSIDVTNVSAITEDIIPAIEEFVCLFMAILLLIKMRQSPSARWLAAVFMTMALIYMSYGASIRGDILGKLIITNLMMMLPIVFYHFLVVLFEEKGDIRLPRRILSFMYALAATGFLIRFLYLYPPTAYEIHLYNPSVTLGFFLLGFLFNMYILTMLYVRFRKQQSHMSSIIKSVWLACMVSFLPVICFSFLPKLIKGIQALDFIYTSWIILLFPISFAYMIATDKLYDFDLMIRRILSAGLLAIIPVSLLTGSYVGLIHTTADKKQILFLFTASLLLITWVLYSAEYWTTRFESVLFPRKHVLNTALKNISKKLGTISSLRELKDIILAEIVDTLHVTGAAVVFRYRNDTEIIYAGEVDTAQIRQLADASPRPTDPYYTFIEMNSHEEYTSYLVITRKKSHTMLGKEELHWLQLITSYLEVSLENVLLIRKLTRRLQQLASQLPVEDTAPDIQWFRKVMFELQEEERIRIATDLHDTTMQDLFFLKKRLIALVEQSFMNGDSQQELNSIIQFVEMINVSLRESCFELNPHLLQEVGLMRTLEMYVEKESYTAPFQLELHAGHMPGMESKDLLTKRHLFRIVQELINNAKKHAQASTVSFQIGEASGSFCLTYEDDGIGFDDSKVRQAGIGASGMGMEQIRGRILHMGGQLELVTAAGQGTKIIITVPIEGAMSA